MSKTKHDSIINREFTDQAIHFNTPGLTLTNKDLLGWIVFNLCLQTRFRVLDVAAGTCLLSKAVAPHVKHVTALDATPAMLDKGREEIARAGLDNVDTMIGLAERLPFDDGSFDMVISRLALHHFLDWRLSFAEMVRVTRPGGLVGVVDLLTPTEEFRKVYNTLERQRDPSHVMALTREELAELIDSHGLKVRNMNTRDVEVNFEKWFAMAGGAKIPGTRETLRKALEAEIQGGPETGMRPFIRDNRLMFLQTWTVVAARK